MTPEEQLERFRQLVADDRQQGSVRSLESYQRLFVGLEELIAGEYARVVDSAPPLPRPIEPPASTDSILARLPRGDGGLQHEGDIARGGMGAVERVRDDALQRVLARKVMLPESESDALSVHRFLEEAQVTAQLDHPGVVPVHQLGRDADGRLFFTMKLVKGRTLSRIFELVRAGRENWTNTRAVEAFIRICETLAFAHQKGVVHRDLKPANIMVGNYGELYVMDWGLAKVVGDRAEPADAKTPTPEPRSMVRTVRSADTTDDGDSATATGAGYVLGTPAYMPLEQAMGCELDARSDIYALGSMLYELLVGHHPYADKSRSARDVVVAVVAGPPTPIRKLKPQLSGELPAICEKAMARDPADRYQTAGELAQELRNFIEGRVVRAYRTGAFVELRKWVHRNRALASAVGAAFLLLVVGLVASSSLYQQAVVESERAQREAYRAAIAAAAAQLENHDHGPAEARLDALPEHLRGWEWRHLRSRVEPSLARIPMQAITFDARTGKVLGTRPGQGLLAYDLATGATTEVLPKDVVDKGSGFLSSDGRYCRVRLAGGGVGIRDLSTSRIVLRGKGNFRRDRPWLFNGKRLIDVETGREVRLEDAAETLARLARSKEQVSTLASPDRRRLALIRDDIVRILDVATGERIGETIVVGGEAKAATWSPDSSRFAACGVARQITVIDATTGTVDRTLVGRDGYVQVAAFSADGQLLLTSTVHGAQVWDLRSHADPFVLRGHASYVYPVAFSPDGARIASGGWDGHVGQSGSLRLWDAATGLQITKTIRAKMVLWAAFSPDGRRLFASLPPPGGLRLLDADTLDDLRSLSGQQHFVGLSPDGTRVAVPYRRQFHVIDTATGAVLAELPAGTSGAVAYGPRWIGTVGRTGQSGGSLTLWNARTYEREAEIPGAVSALAFEPNGTRIVAAVGGGVARVFDGVTKERLAELPGHGRQILCVRFSPDGSRILVGGRDHHIHVWDAETYDEIVQLRGHTSYVYSMDFSPDGETLVSGSGDGTVRLWGTQPPADRYRAIAEREKLVAELQPQVDRLFEELQEPQQVIARLRKNLTGRRQEVALQLALAAAVARRGG